MERECVQEEEVNDFQYNQNTILLLLAMFDPFFDDTVNILSTISLIFLCLGNQISAHLHATICISI